MRHSIEDGALTICLEDRIDVANAQEVEDQLWDLVRSTSPQSVTLDADALDYISSAGLRVVVRLLKSFGQTKIINARPQTYDVFQLTGLTEMMEITRRPRELSLEGLPQIGAGAFGRVYRLDAERVVKVYSPLVNPLSKIERERQVARQAFMHGIPSSIPFETVRAGDEYGIVYELIDARTIGETVAAQPDQLQEYGQRMAELLRQLHSTRFECGSLPDARLIFHGWVDLAERSRLYAAETIVLLRDFVDHIPEGDTFVHGDFHPANIMVLPNGELTLIDMGDSSMGDPIIDLAGMYHVVRVAARRPGGAERLTGMPAEMLDRLWDVFVRTYFGLGDGASTDSIERKLRVFALPRTMGSIARSKLITDEARRVQAHDAEQAFLAGYREFMR